MSAEKVPTEAEQHEEERKQKADEEEMKKDRVKTITVIATRHAGAYTVEPTTGTVDIRLTRPKKAKADLQLQEGQDFIMYPTREEGVYILMRMEKAIDALGAKFFGPSDLKKLAAEIRVERNRDMRRRIGPLPIRRFRKLRRKSSDG